jgi:hypothetical protein
MTLHWILFCLAFEVTHLSIFNVLWMFLSFGILPDCLYNRIRCIFTLISCCEIQCSARLSRAQLQLNLVIVYCQREIWRHDASHDFCFCVVFCFICTHELFVHSKLVYYGFQFATCNHRCFRRLLTQIMFSYLVCHTALPVEKLL